MSKRDLAKYLKELNEDQLQEQVLDLYTRFKEVKEYYNFVFNPKEDKMLEDAKTKIAKEYNLHVRRPKARRSVAQKLIKHFKKLEVDPQVIQQLMVFNIEMAILFSTHKRIKQDAFYVSMFNSFKDLLQFMEMHQIKDLAVAEKLVDQVQQLNWFNAQSFENELNQFEGNI